MGAVQPVVHDYSREKARGKNVFIQFKPFGRRLEERAEVPQPQQRLVKARAADRLGIALEPANLLDVDLEVVVGPNVMGSPQEGACIVEVVRREVVKVHIRPEVVEVRASSYTEDELRSIGCKTIGHRVLIYSQYDDYSEYSLSNLTVPEPHKPKPQKDFEA